MLTAADDLASVRQALAKGAIDHVIKPFEQARLHDAVSRVTGRRGFPGSAFTKHRLDRFLGLPGASLPKGIEAGMLKRTRQILEEVGRDDSQDSEGVVRAMSAEEVGAQLGVSRVTAWRYLEYLLETEQVELNFSYVLPG